MALEQHSDDSLKVVLLGPTGSGKSAIANVILDWEAFAESPTTECQAQQRKFKGRSIWVIDTPGLSESCEVRREIKKSSTLGPPAPTAFLFLVDLCKKTDEKWKTYLKLVEEIFGKNTLTHVMVLFTRRENLTKGGFEKRMSSKETRELLQSCGGGYHTFNSKAEIEPSHVVELLEKIEAMMVFEWLSCTDLHDIKPDLKESEFRIVLLGKTGTGKSAAGNTILRRNVFKEDVSSNSVTETCQRAYNKVVGYHIKLVDTPGLFDTTKTTHEVKNEIERCVEFSLPGPHAFLLVMRLDVRFTEEDRKAVEWIQKNFGEGAAQFTIVLFTHADQLKGKSVEDIIKQDLQDVVDSCGGGYLAFNNEDRESQNQVKELLEKMCTMVRKNGGKFYTNEMYQEAQKILRDTTMAVTGVIGGAATGAAVGFAAASLPGALVGASTGIVAGGGGAALISFAENISKTIKK